MRLLLLSMPDSFEHTPALAIRMPNCALASLAGNVGAHHAVAIADLILTQGAVRPTIERLLRDFAPQPCQWGEFRNNEDSDAKWWPRDPPELAYF